MGVQQVIGSVRARALRVPALAAVTLAVVAIGWPSPVAAGLAPTGTGLPTATGTWGTVPLAPVLFSDPYSYVGHGFEGTSYAVDASGNVYTLPCGENGNYIGYHVCPTTTSTTGIEKYSPSTGAVTILDSGTTFANMQAIAASATGTVYVIANYGTIYSISPSGTETIISNPTVSEIEGGPAPISIAVDPSGHVFITDFTYNNAGSGSPTGEYSVFEYLNGGWVAITTTTAYGLGNLAVGPNGDIYVVGFDFSSDAWTIVQVLPTGPISEVPGLVGAGGRRPESVAVDNAGNLYVVEEGSSNIGSTSSAIIEVTASGPQYVLPPTPAVATNGWSEPDELYFAGSTLYLWDEYPYQDANPGVSQLYTWGTGLNGPVATALSSVARVNSVYQQSVSASWNGTGAPSYRCTLLYGFNDPSPFTITTPSTSCTFTNLALGAPFGISVVAVNGSSVSRASVSFATPAKFTITCVRYGHLRHVTGTNPRCPGGWRER